MPTASFRTAASTTPLRTTSFRATSSLQKNLAFSALVQLLCSPTSSSATAFEERRLQRRMSFRTTVLELELEELLANKTCSLGPYYHLEQEKLWSSSASATQLREEQEEATKAAFSNSFQTENFHNFIFTSFVYKIQLQQLADSFQRNLCLSATQRRSFQNRIFLTSAWTSSSQRTSRTSLQRS